MTYKLIVGFIRHSTLRILIFSLIGLSCGGAFLILSSAKYEAYAQIQLNQVPTTGYSAINIDNRDNTIASLAAPSTYTKEIIQQCGSTKGGLTPAMLANKVKVIPIIETISILKISVTAETPLLAAICLESIYKNVQLLQKKTMLQRVERAKLALSQLNKMSNEERTLRGGEQERLRTEEKNSLEFFILWSKLDFPELSPDIYVSPDPIYPNKIKTLIISLFSGLIFGIWYSIVKAFILKNN